MSVVKNGTKLSDTVAEIPETTASNRQKTNWFCHLCHEECHDEQQYTLHITTEGHRRNEQPITMNPFRNLDEYSRNFANAYLDCLRRTSGTKRAKAKRVYRDYISQKIHLNLHETKWTTLQGFVKWLGKENHCVVCDAEDGLFVTLINIGPDIIVLDPQDDVSNGNRNVDHASVEPVVIQLDSDSDEPVPAKTNQKHAVTIVKPKPKPAPVSKLFESDDDCVVLDSSLDSSSESSIDIDFNIGEKVSFLNSISTDPVTEGTPLTETALTHADPVASETSNDPLATETEPPMDLLATESPTDPLATVPPTDPLATVPPTDPLATVPPTDPLATVPPTDPLSPVPQTDPLATVPPSYPFAIELANDPLAVQSPSIRSIRPVSLPRTDSIPGPSQRKNEKPLRYTQSPEMSTERQAILEQKLVNFFRDLEEEDEKVVDWDDDNEHNSAYLRKHRMAVHAVSLYEKLAKFCGGNGILTGRPIQKVFLVRQVTKYPDIDLAVEKFLNSFCKPRVKSKLEVAYATPEYNDILEVVNDTIATKQIVVLPSENETLAQELFRFTVKQYKERRRKELRVALPDLYASALEDPADKDPELRRKLAENDTKKRSEAEILKEFVEKENARQAAQGDEAEEADEEDEDDDDEHELHMRKKRKIGTLKC